MKMSRKSIICWLITFVVLPASVITPDFTMKQLGIESPDWFWIVFPLGIFGMIPFMILTIYFVMKEEKESQKFGSGMRK